MINNKKLVSLVLFLSILVNSIYFSVSGDSQTLSPDIPVDLSSNTGWSSYWGNTNFTAMSGDIMLGAAKQGEYAFANNTLTVRSTANVGGVFWAMASTPAIQNVDLDSIRYLRYTVDVKNGNDAWNIQVKNLNTDNTIDTLVIRESKDTYLAFPDSWTGTANLQVSVVANFYGDVVNEVTVNSLTLSSQSVQPNSNPAVDVTNNSGWSSYKGNTNMTTPAGKVMLGSVEYGDYTFNPDGLTLKATNNADNITWMTATAPTVSRVDLGAIHYISYDVAAQNSDSKWNIEVKNLTTNTVITSGDILGSKKAFLDISAWIGIGDLQVSVTTYYGLTPYTITVKKIEFKSDNTTPNPDPVPDNTEFDGTINTNAFNGWSSYWGNVAFSDASGNIMLGSVKMGEYSFADGKINIKATNKTTDVNWVNVSSPVLKKVNLDKFRYLRYSITTSNDTVKWNITIKNNGNGKEVNTGDTVGSRAAGLKIPDEWKGEAELEVAVNLYYSDGASSLTASNLIFLSTASDNGNVIIPVLDITKYNGWSAYWNVDKPLTAQSGDITLTNYGKMGTYSFSGSGLNMKATAKIKDVFWSSITSPLLKDVDLDQIKSLKYSITDNGGSSNWNITIRNMTVNKDQTTGYIQGSNSGELSIPESWKGTVDLLVTISLDYRDAGAADITVKKLALALAKNPTTGDKGNSIWQINFILLLSLVVLGRGFLSIYKKSKK